MTKDEVLSSEYNAVGIVAKRPPPKTVSRFYRPELDILRFLAFLLVFNAHFLPTSNRTTIIWRAWYSFRGMGSFGVCLFFSLSSYLITELLFREIEKTGTVHLRAFYIRRILRIWPLYFLVLFAGYIWGRIVPEYAISAGRLIAFLLLAGNWYTAQYNFGSNFTFPLWSISLEEQFYLIWPTIICLWGRFGIAVACLVTWCCSYAVLFVLCYRHANLGHSIWANSLVQFQFFALGGILSLVLKGRVPDFGLLPRSLLLLAGLFAFFTADFVFHIIHGNNMVADVAHTIPGYLLVAAGVTLLFFSMLGARIPAATAPLVYLGKISYGLYVFHVLAIDLIMEAGTQLHLNSKTWILVKGITALLLTVGLAMLSYRFFESPFLRFKERFSFVKSRAV